MMVGFKREVSERLPLAKAALEAFEFAFDPKLLTELYERHRGRGYTDVLTFPHLAGLVRSCLLEHEGSGHRGCTEAQRDGNLGVDESSFYRKLAKMPVAVSRALLSEGTARLGELCAGTAAGAASDLLPGCFDDMEAVIVDGKKIKRAARRLKPTRGYTGALLGAKSLVAMSLRSGLALAMSDSFDGQTNDVPLVPELLPQVRAVVAKPILWMADRQFGGLGIPPQLTARPGDHYVIRVSTSTPFTPDPARPAKPSTDEKGREVIDEFGTFGKNGNRAIQVRRVILRTGKAAHKTGKGSGAGGDVILITDLTDRKAYPASELLKLYRVVSTRNLFYDLRRELLTWNYLELDMPGNLPAAAEAMRRRLAALLEGTWDPEVYTKASDKKPRIKPKRKSLQGGHTSVQKLLDGRVKVRVAKN